MHSMSVAAATSVAAQQHRDNNLSTACFFPRLNLYDNPDLSMNTSIMVVLDFVDLNEVSL